MNTRKQYINQNINPKLKRIHLLLQVSIYLMVAIVLYDAFVHTTPLYYVTFYFGGFLVGGIFKRMRVIRHESENNEFVLSTSKWDIAISVALIFVRFGSGAAILKEMNVVWVTDATYLIFIGLYRSKWKGMVKQIDEIVYKWITTSKVSV